MRRLVAAIIAAVVALTVTACGGGGSKAPTTTTTKPNATPAAPAAAGSGAAASSQQGPDKSPTEALTDEAFPRNTQIETITPSAILENLDARRAQMIWYYDSTQLETDDERAQIDKVMQRYRGLIELVAFDMRRSKPGSGTMDPEIGKAATLADRLGIRSTPYLMIVDEQGLITWRWRGPLDADMLEREVMRVTQ